MGVKEKILEEIRNCPVFDTHEHWGVWNQYNPYENTMKVENIFK